MFKNKTSYLLVLLLSISTLCSAQWSLVDTAGFSAVGGIYKTSIVFDNNDTPYICFTDNGNNGGLTVMKYNGSNWTNVGTAGFTLGSAVNPDLAISSKDTLYTVFSDVAQGSKVSVMKYNGIAWVNVGSAGFSSGSVNNTTIAIDNNDTVYVAFRDGTNSQKATVMKYNGTSWQTVGSAGFSVGASYDITLGIDHKDSLYIAMRDGANSQKATVMKFDGTNWNILGNAGFSSSTPDGIAIDFDVNNTPYVAYSDIGNGYKATAMKYNGSTWVNVGNAGFSSGITTWTNLAFNKKNEPYVCYKDYTQGGKATLMKYDGTNWVVEGTAGFTAGAVYYGAVAFDGNGTPYYFYRDSLKNGRATVMKYTVTTWNGSTWSNGTPDSTTYAAIGSNIAPPSFSCYGLTINKGFSLNTGTSIVVNIYGYLANYGNGLTGTGKLFLSKNGIVNLFGDTIGHEGAVIVESGCTLQTNGLLLLKSNATNTGCIGNSAGTINGDVTVQRYNTAKRAFRFYGHPFSSSIALSQLTDDIDITGAGGSVNGFTTTASNNPSAYWFDVTAGDTATSGANSGWKAFTSAISVDWDRYELLRLLVRGSKGQGLTSSSYTPSASVFEASGTVNQGTQVVTLTKGAGSNFVSCGNPFPSPVQMNTVAKGSNIGANYYVWDATSGVSGAYVTNAFTVSYVLPPWGALFTTASTNGNNTLTFEEADKATGGASIFKTTGVNDWIELIISDSTIRWDRLLIRFDDNSMTVEDKLDGKKLYNPGLDFFTLSKDDVRLAVDVRPYDDAKSIPLGLTAYNRYNRYVIRTGMYNAPAGTKLILHDKYLNTQQELKAGFEYWFDVTSDTLSQGNNRFEINMVGKPTNIITTSATTPKIQLIPNPAYNEVKVSFDNVEGTALVKLTNITGQVVYLQEVNAAIGSLTIPLVNMPSGMYIVELQSQNARLTEKLIKE